MREAIHGHGHGRPLGVPLHLHDLEERGRPPLAATTACPEPLYPPPHHLGRYRADAYGDYLFYAGRLDRLKRLDLAIDAMKRVRSGARLKIAGAGPLAEELRKQIAGLGVEDRVELLGFVSAEELVDLYAGCRAAYYAPLNEDYGYVTVEAFLSRKPVVTTTDAGRAARVRDGRRERPRGGARPRGDGGRPSTGCGRCPRRACGEMGEAGRAPGGGHHLGPRHRPPDGVARVRLGRLEPAAPVAVGDRRLRGGGACPPWPRRFERA